MYQPGLVLLERKWIPRKMLEMTGKGWILMSGAQLLGAKWAAESSIGGEPDQISICPAMPQMRRVWVHSQAWRWPQSDQSWKNCGVLGDNDKREFSKHFLYKSNFLQCHLTVTKVAIKYFLWDITKIILVYHNPIIWRFKSYQSLVTMFLGKFDYFKLVKV
jgi:hypothetical protein